jgi:hypothetical protein
MSFTCKNIECRTPKSRKCAFGYCLACYRRFKKHGKFEYKRKYVKIDKSNWTDTNIAWLTGIIEGEGNFNLRESKLSARIRIRMTDLDVLQRCKDITKCGIINGPYRKNHKKYKPYWDWSVSIDSEFLNLAYAILPLLLKRRKSKLIETLQELGYWYAT